MEKEPEAVLQENDKKKHILIVTGLSGAGKNVVMRALEDLGFYCVDNLPVPLISTFLKFVAHSHSNLLKVALGIDARGGKFLKDFLREIEQVRSSQNAPSSFKIVFLQASDSTLIKRFEETRRKHPLAKNSSLREAIKKEKKVLEPIMNLADVVLDTDTFNIHELRRWVRTTFSHKANHEMMLNLISFGFKYGVPQESNLVYDVRFLPNPYFIPDLKAMDGRKAAVQQFLFEQPAVNDYWERLVGFLQYCIQKYSEEGRPFVNVAIGCTGGKHRSVCLVERLAKESWPQVRFLIHHRDVNKA